jgi:hypothetical protein
MRTTSGIGLMLLLIGAGGGLWMHLQPGRIRDDRARHADGSRRESASSAELTLAVGSDPQQSAARERIDVQRPDDGPLLEGLVRDQDGEAVPGAVVRWIGLKLEDTERTPTWAGGGWGAPVRSHVETTSDPAGRFSFERGPDGAHEFGSLVVGSLAGYATAGERLESERARWGKGVTLVLEASPAIEVLVVDPEGRGVPGATVHRAGASAESFTFERYVEDATLTDGDGRARLPALRGAQALWSTKDELVSAPWQGRDPLDVVLRLDESFLVSGTLAIDRSDWAGYFGELRIVVLAQDGNLWIPLVRLHGVLDGEWGPLRVPLGRGSRFEARLEGVPIPPQVVALGVPRPGEHRRIDFRGEKEACELWLWPIDERGEPILAAHVTAWWRQPTVASGPNVVHGGTRPDGVIYLGSFPAGSVEYRVSAPGFATSEGYVDVPSDTGIEVTLYPGGSLRGRCLYAGEPVRDFQVQYRRAWSGLGSPR